MSLFLAVECSYTEGSLALVEDSKKNFNCLKESKWTHQAKTPKKSHSDKLPLEIEQVLKSSKKNLSELEFLAVGTGPGRWTGTRVAVNMARSLSFSLKLPIYSVHSLRICAEPLLTSSQSVFVAFNAFKNQVYFAEFNSPLDIKGNIRQLSFEDWKQFMEDKSKSLKKPFPICISDLEDFYPLDQNLKKLFSFKKLYPNALDLAQIIFKYKKKLKAQSWSELKAFYLRSPLE